MKYRPRIDPYALNPEKFLTADAKKKQKEYVSGSEVPHETGSQGASDERILGHVIGLSGQSMKEKKPNRPPDPTPPSGASHF